MISLPLSSAKIFLHPAAQRIALQVQMLVSRGDPRISDPFEIVGRIFRTDKPGIALRFGRV